MAITLKRTNDGQQVNTVLKCGDLHGAPDLKTPSPKVHRRYFWGNLGEVEIYGGKTGRPVVLNAIFNDSTWLKPWYVVNYLKTTLDPIIGINLEIEMTYPDTTKANLQKCTFEKYELVPQPGHQMVAPLKDTTTMLNGTADTWWIEVNMFFHQLQTGISDSLFVTNP